ncbi:MarR family transcriptional regulator [Comamonas sp. CMM03]|jgi:MarR family transcriptional regulator for hemolysin|nr:MarR family transcriptional regulator [Comamonas sp. CMM03]
MPPVVGSTQSTKVGHTLPSNHAEAPLFGYTLMSLGRQWRRVVHLRLAELGLTDATWAPLFHLHAAGQGISLKALAQRVGLDSSTLVRVVDLLENRGLVRRETDAHDRRSKLLQVTESGNAAVADVRAKLVQVEGRLLDGMDAATSQLLLQGMLQLQQRMAQELGDAVEDADDTEPTMERGR